MLPQNTTPNSLFQGTNVYIVPKYQRLYVWDERDQWAPFWEDVTDIAGKLLHAASRRGATNVDTNDAEPHFFGALVLKSSGYTPRMVTQWKVIDGQQRLTTMQLMMAAVADELQTNGQTSVAAPLRNLISNYPHEKPFAKHHLKIVHSSDHYAGFFEAMNPDTDKIAIVGPMGECYRYFRKAAHGWMDARSAHPSSPDLAAAALTTVIMVKLDIVGIYLDSQEQEHKIFESLNARGEPLTEWDKIKNFLLFKASNEAGVNQDEFFDKYLDGFDQDWWRIEVGRGVGARPRTDMFADYWLESKIGEPVGARRVFREFQKYVADDADGLIELCDELIKDAMYFTEYARRQKPEPSAELRFHNKRLAIGVDALWPLLFELKRVFDRLNCDVMIQSQCFAYLESFVVRRMIVGHQAASYPQLALDVIKIIGEKCVNRGDLPDVIAQHLLEYTRSGNRWPNDSDVRRAVRTRRMPGYARKIVLESIEASLIPQTAGYQVLSDNLEVEHLMAQGWRTNDWPLDVTEDQIAPAERRDEAIQTIGNLTLINSGLNKRLSNRSWRAKKQLIEKSDNLFINKRLLDDATVRWDEELIEQRGEWMAEMVCNIWPRPQVGSTI